MSLFAAKIDLKIPSKSFIDMNKAISNAEIGVRLNSWSSEVDELRQLSLGFDFWKFIN